LVECGGESCECWVEDVVDDEDFSVEGLDCRSVDWVSVDGDDVVEWGGVVVDTEWGSNEGVEGGVEWEQSSDVVCRGGVGDVVVEGLVLEWVDGGVEDSVGEGKVIWNDNGDVWVVS